MQKMELDWKKSNASNSTLPFKLSKHQLKTQVLFKVLLFRDKQILPPTGLTTLSMISNVWKETANLERKLLFQTCMEKAFMTSTLSPLHHIFFIS